MCKDNERNYEIVRMYQTSDVHEFKVDWNGYGYLVIIGTHINGGFFVLPEYGIGGELSNHWSSDISGNASRITRYLKDKEASMQIAMAIAEYMEIIETIKLEEKS